MIVTVRTCYVGAALIGRVEELIDFVAQGVNGATGPPDNRR
jgi:hypothetical protein